MNVEFREDNSGKTKKMGYFRKTEGGELLPGFATGHLLHLKP